ncbi:MAG: PfkB family carbohydrate kinase [Anaerolineales bacterium]|jgi:sugar/nucleoside kinase (ribokinase family)
MPFLVPLDPVDYVVIGHLSCDLTPEGPRLGGTAAYAALTAQALGLRVGVVTSWGGELPLEPLVGIRIVSVPAEHSTTFENILTPGGRLQVIHHVGEPLLFEHIPDVWRQAPIVHLGPIAQEGKSLVDGRLASSLFGLTPQGWLRSWDADGRVRPCAWPEASEVLPKMGATVLSIDDVGGDENQVEAMASISRVLAVTEGPCGARLYWNGDLRRFHAPARTEVDPTGAGDVFAAAFFYRLFSTRDPWAAARFATHLASYSVTRKGLEGIPNQEEIRTCLVEVL